MTSLILDAARRNRESRVYSRVLDFVLHEIKDRYDFCYLFGHRVIVDGICEHCFRSAEAVSESANEEVNVRQRELPNDWRYGKSCPDGLSRASNIIQD